MKVIFINNNFKLGFTYEEGFSLKNQDKIEEEVTET